MKRSEVIKLISENYSVNAEYLWDGETALKKFIEERWNLVKPRGKERGADLRFIKNFKNG